MREAWEIAGDTHILKMYRPKNDVLATIGNFARRTPTRELHVDLKIE